MRFWIWARRKGARSAAFKGRGMAKLSFLARAWRLGTFSWRQMLNVWLRTVLMVMPRFRAIWRLDQPLARRVRTFRWTGAAPLSRRVRLRLRWGMKLAG